MEKYFKHSRALWLNNNIKYVKSSNEFWIFVVQWWDKTVESDTTYNTTGSSVLSWRAIEKVTLMMDKAAKSYTGCFLAPVETPG